jgi:hypothetical protein
MSNQTPNLSSISNGRSITLPKSLVNGSSQGQNDFSLIQQQFFPPLGSNDSSLTTSIHFDDRSHHFRQQKETCEQLLIPHLPYPSHPESASSASVDPNSELSADGLNKGAKEFVPKFAVASPFNNLQNDTRSLSLVSNQHVNAPYISSSLCNVPSTVDRAESRPVMQLTPVNETSEWVALTNSPSNSTIPVGIDCAFDTRTLSGALSPSIPIAQGSQSPLTGAFKMDPNAFTASDHWK